MARFHINGKGEAGTCRAKNNNCPFGDEAEHYDSADEAREAFEQEMGGGMGGVTKSKKAVDPLSADAYDVPEELREAANRVLGYYRTASTGSHSDYGDDFDRVRAENDAASEVLRPQVEWSGVMGQPCKLTRQETNLLRKELKNYDLTEDQFQEYADFNCEETFGKEMGEQMHPTRRQKYALETNSSRVNHFSYAAFIFNETYREKNRAADKAHAEKLGYEYEDDAYEEDLLKKFRGELPATTTSASDGGAHHHGAWFGRKDAKASGSGSVPKGDSGPDPEFIEALRKMYIAKFGHDPEDDGVDTGTLLAMFNKGELA